MLDKELLEQQLLELPLYLYAYIDPNELEFTQRVRYICQNECPMFGTTWACPPAVGAVAECEKKCRGYESCLLIGTVTEVSDIANIEESLKTRAPHEDVTNTVRDLLRQQGIEPYVLSTEACAACERCAWLDGQPCRHPDRMHPCVESHGINIIPTLESCGVEFQYGDNIVSWFSLLFF